jgi:phosphatidylglycerol---prolipoprotein diacylglyceryl transferase
VFAVLLSLPSPPSPIAFEAGPLTLTYHGLLIAVGVAVGALLTWRELERRGQDGTLVVGALLFAIPLGVAGARLFHVLTEYDRYAERTASALQIWDGGLAVYGAVAGGFLGLLIFCWFGGVRPLAFADAAAPGLVLGQAIGRWGNYFNQELFGKPSDLPWAIEIAPHSRPAEFADATSFHPAFLYESVWDLLVCLVLLWAARRFANRLENGDVFLLYVFLYSVGRFFVETLRVDEPFVVWGSVGGNLFVGGILALGCAIILLIRRFRKGRTYPESG